MSHELLKTSKKHSCRLC